MPENDETKHDPNYCELEHLLKEMAKESENKAFYENFRQHYNEFFNRIKQIKPIQSEQKKRTKCWLQPYITLSVCLERGFCFLWVKRSRSHYHNHQDARKKYRNA